MQSNARILSIAIASVALAAPLAHAQALHGDGIVKVKSAYPVDETIARIKADIAKKGILFFSEVDQAQLAASAGISIPRSTLLTFGNPPLGVQFITAKPEAA